jgi:hypothetical protein
MVPFAKDGTYFHRGLKREKNSCYQVGDKGDEKSFERFEDALKYLENMKPPRWRRPNPKGNWGLVTAVRWDALPE